MMHLITQTVRDRTRDAPPCRRWVPFATLQRMPASLATRLKALPVRGAAGAGSRAAVAATVVAAAGSADGATLAGLLERIARQDQAALGAFYQATAGRVYGLALRIARSEALAEEISGDVYLQVWKNAARYSAERGHPLAWLMVITRSRALDQLRRLDPAESHAEPELLAEAVDENDPRNLLAAVQTNSALHAALAALPPVQRQLLALAFFQGLTHSEIAAHVRMPLGTVKTHVRRALQALRATMESA